MNGFLKNLTTQSKSSRHRLCACRISARTRVQRPVGGGQNSPPPWFQDPQKAQWD